MRASGILMHVTSLPGPNGIGAMGKPAHRFVDFWSRPGRSTGKSLPLSPTGYGDSPYQSFSAFAGNHYLIDLGSWWMRAFSAGRRWRRSPGAVRRTGWIMAFCMKTGGRFCTKLRTLPGDAQPGLSPVHPAPAGWLRTMPSLWPLKEEFQGKPWQEWPDGLRLRQPEEMAAYREKLKYKIAFQYFLQFKFFEQWDRLHRYAKSKGVRIIGDVPIYVPWTPPTCGQTASCSSWMRTEAQAGGRGAAGCVYRRRAAVGNLCTTGRSCARPAMPGGCAAEGGGPDVRCGAPGPFPGL